MTDTPDWHLRVNEDKDGGVTLVYRGQDILDVDLDDASTFTVRVLDDEAGKVKAWVKGRVAP